MAELPIAEFIRQRLKEYDSKFEVRKGTAFDTLFFKPAQFILQPLREEADKLFIGSSLRRIMQTENPDAFDEALVDEVVANVYVYRVEGSKSSGVARVYYDVPVSREYPEGGFTVSGSNGKNYYNPAPFAVTSTQMEMKIEEGNFYFDIPVVSEDIGKDTEILEEGGLVEVIGDPDVISVTNKLPIRGGSDRETNTQLIERARQAITVRDLVTGKGSSAILFENFPGIITEMQAVGFGDPEMMRDILYNTHVGGKHDQYIKTNYITTKSSDFVGILLDLTRSSITNTQLELTGNYDSGDTHFLGETSVDRTLGQPVVRDVKPYVKAILRPTPATNLLGEINLLGYEYLKITMDDVTLTVRVAGSNPVKTVRQEIINAINNAFGYNIASAYNNTIQIESITEGLGSKVIINSADAPKGDAFGVLFSETPPLVGEGDGPRVFIEDTDYKILDEEGEIGRVVGNIVQDKLSTTTGLITSPDYDVIEATGGHNFGTVQENHILSLESGDPTIDGDYRIVEVVDSLHIRLDKPVITSGSLDITGKYYIRDTGIKNGELLEIQFYFNPLSIDIGKYIKLDELGRSRGLRPGREDMTIQDVAFLKINSIDVIDPVSGEPTGDSLKADGGYGMGGFGEGAFGIGSSSEFRLVVNDPTVRYSAFEDSYIVIDSAYQGYSFRVNYDCVPEIEDIHNFCRSDSERVLDGDVLAKHFIPAYVDAIIEYNVDKTDSSIPDNTTLTSMVKDFISSRPAGSVLQVSDISQFILKTVDPYYRYGGNVNPFSIKATIHNTDGTITIIEDNKYLEIPTPDPFPKYTEAPISARIAHWLANDIQLVRL